MNDPLLVRRFEGFGDLLRDGESLVERDRTARDALREVVALDEFHHERGDVARALEAVDRRNVRVVERREDLGFSLEAGQPIGICRNCCWQHLKRNLALQVRVGRAVDLAHPAFAEERGHSIGAETGAGSQSQKVRGLYDGGGAMLG